MKKTSDKSCHVCGKAEKSCVYCRAEVGHRSFFGIPKVSWLILAVGGVIAAILLNS